MNNIPGFDLLGGGLTRVHPGGYAALINAALANGVSSIKMNSCWRPMVGSIAHRAGLGLDVWLSEQGVPVCGVDLYEIGLWPLTNLGK